MLMPLKRGTDNEQIKVAHPVGQISTILLALSLTWVAADSGWTWALTDWDGWYVLSIIILVAAWVNVFAWMASSWGVVGVCSLLTFAAPWGFIYPGILAGPILAISAGLHLTRGRAHHPAGTSRLIATVKRMGKVLLALVTLGALADAIGLGAYVAPAMLPFLWLAAWGSSVPMKLFWTILALPCGWLVGWLIANPGFDSWFATSGQESPDMTTYAVAALVTLALFAIPFRYGRRKF